jgi:hypothetical protein
MIAVHEAKFEAYGRPNFEGQVMALVDLQTIVIKNTSFLLSFGDIG